MSILEERINLLQMMVNRKTRLMLMNLSHVRPHNVFVDRAVQHDLLVAIADNEETDQYMMRRFL